MSIKIALDTNVISSLLEYDKYLRNEVSSKNSNLEDRFGIKYLYRVINEDSNKRIKDLNIFYTQEVFYEIFERRPQGIDPKIVNFVKRMDINPSSFIPGPLLDKDLECYNFFNSLLKGKVSYYSQFDFDLFEFNSPDRRALAEAAMEGAIFITLNKKHFIGENNSVKEEIKARLERANNHSKNRFKVECKNSTPMTPSEFLEVFYPKSYDEMKENIKNYKGCPLNKEQPSGTTISLE